MLSNKLYEDIANRSNGDIYIGVVGPVRCGKSTFITRFMNKMVLPFLEDDSKKQRIIDELPQSSQGKVIMTTQPKFVPDTAISIKLDNQNANIRLIDSVGYPYEGANGFYEDGNERMVKTPWNDNEVGFIEAARIGTDKVMNDHSNIGILVTNDGSVVDIPRDNFKTVEKEIVDNMKKIDKPFVILLNSKHPNANQTIELKEILTQEYGVPVITKNVLDMEQVDFEEILLSILSQFPMKMFNIKMPKYLQALDINSDIIQHIIQKIHQASSLLCKMDDYKKTQTIFDDDEYMLRSTDYDIDYSQGKACLTLNPKPELFYKVLSNECGQEILDEFKLVSYIKDLSVAKLEYDKIKNALDEVKEYGYGVVTPTIEDMELDPPEVINKGNKCIVKMRATAPTYHIMRVDVETEVNPVFGGETQTEDMVRSWLDEYGEDYEGIWQTNMFGKTLNLLAKEGLENKIQSMPEDVRYKLRKTLSRIINEKKGGVLCVIL